MGKTMLFFFFLLCTLAVQLAASVRDFQEEHVFADYRPNTGGLSRKTFPKGFVFGTATSAYQAEGMADKDGREPSVWDVFIKEPGREPNNASGEVSVDQYHRYKEDVNLMAWLNSDAYRFSISWSRIFPINDTFVITPSRDPPGQLEMAFMPHVEAIAVPVGSDQPKHYPLYNLNHYDLPQALQERYNGWLSEEVVKDFADYAEFCFKMFGDRVKNWFSFNEPRVIAALGYDNGFFAPGRCSKAFGNCTEGNSATEPYVVAHNLIKCHAAAALRYREKYQEKQKGKFGILLDFVWYDPLTRSKKDNYAAQRARDFHIGWFLHPLVYGEYPKTMQNIVGDRLPKFTKAEVEIVKGSLDYVGINQYTAYYTYDQPPQNNTELGYQQDWQSEFAYDRQGVPIGPKAYSYWLYNVPWGLYKAVMYVKERYENPTIILSENRMDQPGNDTLPQGLIDPTRIDYYRNYLAQLKKTIDDGANVVGYFAWSLLDNFEWRSGYTSRFGLVYVDFKTLRRYPKMSAYWFKKLLHRKWY